MTIECEYAPDRKAGKPTPAPKTSETLESEIESLHERVAELKGQLSELSTEPIREAARTLLDLCRSDDDPDEAFDRALQFLMRAADVSDDFDSDNVHFSVPVRVLVEKYGVEEIRTRVRQIGRQLAKSR